ncbi:E3 ubiquitin-protein ligase RGLG3-like [Nymphaea colorata]|nr:E3 ubiquitin-protein ligase RGLG3-like [Nymphaea colorata]
MIPITHLHLVQDSITYSVKEIIEVNGEHIMDFLASLNIPFTCPRIEVEQSDALVWKNGDKGPTSFAPVINASIDIVERSKGTYHVLVIIIDGQVTKYSDPSSGCLSPQEGATIDAIVSASHYPLSIILVVIGDGPWDKLQQFGDNIPRREFDNFQFLNFTKIMSWNHDKTKKEAALALAALMEIPFQYKATQELNYLGHRRGSNPGLPPLPPPREVINHDK